MAHFLNVEQLLEEASNHGNAIPSHYVAAIESAAQALAIVIARTRGDVAITNPASNQPGFGGLCVGFGPKTEGQACPKDFRDYDPTSNWVEGDV